MKIYTMYQTVLLLISFNSLNIDKTSFVLFHPTQKAINYSVRLYINNETVKKEKRIKYLGIFIDAHLSWKDCHYAVLHSDLSLFKLCNCSLG